MPDAAPETRRRGRSERTRAQIVDATQALIHEVGIEAVSIEGVAARAGVGKQTIYRGWGGRTALLADVLIASWAIPDAAASGADPREDVVAWASAVVASVASPLGQAVMHLMGAAASEDAETAAAIERRFVDPLRTRLAELLAAVPAEHGQGATDAIMGGLFFRMSRGVASDEREVRAIVEAVLGRR